MAVPHNALWGEHKNETSFFHEYVQVASHERDFKAPKGEETVAHKNHAKDNDRRTLNGELETLK